MKTTICSLLLALVILLAASCVSNKKFSALQADYNSLQDRSNAYARENQDCQNNLRAANQRLVGIQDQLEAERKNLASLQSALDKCLTSAYQGHTNVSKLVDEINASNKYIQQLIASKNKSDSLNLALTNKITRSLSREEMQDVDVQVLKGVVYVSLSDKMLYKSGSYEISDSAGATLSKIAKIIKDYQDYEVLVEGNTDTIPITRPNIRNNWDLSALRASSVVHALQTTYNIDPKRLTAAGRGEYNPIVSNSSESGRNRNRRTQIIITPKLDQFMDLIDQAPEPDRASNN